MARAFAIQTAALGAAFAAVVAASAAWIVNLRLGPRFEGFTGGAMVVTLPLALLVLAVLWLVVRSALSGRVSWSSGLVILAAAILAYVAVAVTCGPVACFQPGSNRLLGWFLVGGTVLAALSHHFVLTHMRRS